MPSTTHALDTHVFRAPAFGLLATEPLRAVLDWCAGRVAVPPQAIGDGHPVVVYPGLGGGTLATSYLRTYLKDCGFTVHDWEGGVNTGPEGLFDDWLQPLADRVRELHARGGRKVSLVGWSLGGIYAREIAKRHPECVRQVVTLGTPFAALAHGNHAGTVFKLLNREKAQLAPEIETRIRECPPVPTTSIYSKTDGIVSWRGCIEKRSATSESVEVDASHLGMVTHPQVLRVVADRLAQPEGKWRPLSRSVNRPSARSR
jgi:triacylglycerol esterase/lipase EstA (alpha/beta hydrolase family)